MRIYTKTGDDGTTGLFAGPRVPKDHPRIEAYGTVDELNAVLGRARAEGLPADIDQLLGIIQSELFNVGAELATPKPESLSMPLIGPAHSERLERAIDRFETELAPLTQFVLPGGTRAAADLHIARTVARRAERQVVTLSRQPDESVASRLVIYLNRLSDLLFVLSRVVNARAGVADVPWQKMS